jgi:DNA helicase HerA-like ATPase
LEAVGLMRERKGSAGNLLKLAALGDDGLLVGEDGTYVRYLEVDTVNPLAVDQVEGERISASFAQIAARLPDRQSLQLYVQGTTLDLEEILAEETYRCEQAAGAAIDAGEHDRATAIRRLGIAQEQSIRKTAQVAKPLRLRYFVICPWQPTGRSILTPLGSRRGLRVKSAVHERAIRDSLRHSEGVRADLEAMGLSARSVSGKEVLDLLHSRFDPDAQSAGAPPASFMRPEVLGPLVAGESAADAQARALALADAICSSQVDLSERSRLSIGESLEQAFHVSLAPEQTWLGWLLHMMQSPSPFVLSVHIQATERYRERMAQKRRYKRLYGVNRGVEAHGRPLDPDARLQEQEAAELVDELATSAGAGIYRVSIYGAIRESAPDADPERLQELCQSIAREVTMASDARIGSGLFSQARLWESTLPLGRDVANRKRKYVSRNVGDTFPLVGTSCSSPGGIPLGYALPGRTLERIDPFDSAHTNHLMLVTGITGSGKTMATIILLIRAIAQGATGFIIDRAGHFAFLASLIPGAASVEIGGDAHAINSWDVEDPAHLSPEKVDYLLALHALLLGEHHAGQDSYGLTDLEANLLGLAITEVYERCSLTGEEPRELLLQEELERRYTEERAEGSVGIAEALRNLAMRLNNYVLDGPYAYLTDRPTTILSDAPLIVFDTRSVPEAKAAAVLFVLCEYVKRSIDRTRREHLTGQGPKHAWAGRTFLVVDEAWKLTERPATGRWFNEFCRRSRHYALWLIAISQQISDFDNEYGKALLANTKIRITGRQEARELARMREALGNTEEREAAMTQSRTVPGEYAIVYVENGSRGEATVQITVAEMEYWIATSNPARDDPVRRQAIRQTNDDGWEARWEAVLLCADEQWRTTAIAELELAA